MVLIYVLSVIVK